jgi:hypothetical protein
MIAAPGLRGDGGRGWAGEEPEMIHLMIALAIACVVFWRLAVRILAIVAVFLLVTGIAVVIEYLHHLAR